MSSRSPSTWSAPVGRYSFEVSVYSGSSAQFASESSKADKAKARKNATALREALADDSERHPAKAIEAVEELKDSAGAVTTRVEHANRLFKALAEDRLVDPRLLTDEIGSLLGLLDRLDREKRYEEEIRVAKALHGLCVLAFRWLELIRSLRRALAAAEAIGDEAGQAWALNELGALHLCAGDAKRAGEHLQRASELYEKLGDPAGRCATRHNVDSARRDVERPVQIKGPKRLVTSGGSIKPLVACIIGVAALVGLGFRFAPLPTGGVTEDLAASIGARPSNPSANEDATFSFTAEGAKGFECKLDHGPFERCSSPVTYERLNEGEHSFRVRATAMGDNGPAANHVWRIDLTAPTTTITDEPLSRTAETSADFSFTASEDVSRFECRLDDDPFAECASPMSLPGPLEDGDHEFAVRAIDLAGNVGIAATYPWRVSAERTTRVPRLVGRPLAHGIEKLAEAQLRWDVEEVASPEPGGQIVGQDPAEDAEVRVGSTVTVEVPEGTEIAVVPSVLGLSEDEAVARVEEAGLEASIRRDDSPTVPEGLVITQDPDAGTELVPGEMVEITVSLGSQPADLVDLTIEIPEAAVEMSCFDDGSCLMTLTFTVKNQSKTDLKQPFDVLVAADPGERQTVAFPDGLAAEGSADHKMQLKATRDSKLTVEVDPDRRILEVDEENNAATWRDPGVDLQRLPA